MCDLLQKRADEAASEFGTMGYTDFIKMLENEDIDIISIATSGEENGSYHYEPAMIAIEAGKDVLKRGRWCNSPEKKELDWLVT